MKARNRSNNKSNQWVVKDGNHYYGPFPNLMGACDWLDSDQSEGVRGPVEYLELIKPRSEL